MSVSRGTNPGVGTLVTRKWFSSCSQLRSCKVNKLQLRSRPHNWPWWINGRPFSSGFTTSPHITVHVLIMCRLPVFLSASLPAASSACLCPPTPLCLSSSHLTPSPLLVIYAETYWFLSRLLLCLFHLRCEQFFKVGEGGSITPPIGF